MRLPSISRIFNLNDSNWGRGNNGSGNEPPRRPNNNNDGGKNNNNGGPPDLDELWRDFNRRLGGLFGRKPGGPRGGGNGGDNNGRFSPSPRGAGIGVGVIGGIVVLLWLGSGFFIVQEGQVAVVTQFGKYKETTRAGFQWRLPYPIQSHEIVNQSQLRTIEVGFRNNSRSKVLQESLMLTDDENIVDMQFVVQYRLKEGGARDYLFNSRNPDESVKQAAESAMREVVGKKKMDFVLYEGRTEVAAEVTKLMQNIMDIYGTGVLISTVAIQNAQPPEQVQAAFDDAVKAGQDRERQVNEGQAYANEVIPRAAGAASRLLQEAEGYRSRIVENAEGDASRFTQVLTEYQKAPGVTRDRLYLDTMQEVFTNASKVLVDTRSGNNLLYLPLDKIMQQVSKESSAAVAARSNGSSSTMNNGTALPLPAPMSSSVPEPTPREALRSRDRNVPR
ncbi:FtsH protease activity modulator HflK [Pigmentiphaga litoralis]|uniref:Protein HflK n=1 Tax=Pigmentiphaga litoralis TaxID=516702 RepID=A0A7Y9IVQ6_9BURK|nr:membrane protease subunit HflK [Pigmentiphaga litoralis]NYE83829.1 membrane protease subunit HflK [Pigmentiphaga litoralis]